MNFLPLPLEPIHNWNRCRSPLTNQFCYINWMKRRCARHRTCPRTATGGTWFIVPFDGTGRPTACYPFYSDRWVRRPGTAFIKIECCTGYNFPGNNALQCRELNISPWQRGHFAAVSTAHHHNAWSIKVIIRIAVTHNIGVIHRGRTFHRHRRVYGTGYTRFSSFKYSFPLRSELRYISPSPLSSNVYITLFAISFTLCLFGSRIGNHTAPANSRSLRRFHCRRASHAPDSWVLA